MKITKYKFAEHIGEIVGIANDTIPDGTYQIVNVMDNYQFLYNIKEHTIVSAELSENEFTIFTTPVNERLELLYEAILKTIFLSLNTDEDFEKEILAPWVEKAKILKEIIDYGLLDEDAKI